jgi:hypothetical protein
LNEGEWVEHGEEHGEDEKKEIAVKGERANSWLKISINRRGTIKREQVMTSYTWVSIIELFVLFISTSLLYVYISALSVLNK